MIQGNTGRFSSVCAGLLEPEETLGTFDLIIGEWGTQAPPKMRVGVSLLYRNDPNENSFTVVDAAEQLTNSPELAGRALARSEVVGTPLATEVFELVDFILLHDQRIGPIRTMPPSEK
jgi:hypothetical protein